MSSREKMTPNFLIPPTKLGFRGLEPGYRPAPRGENSNLYSLA